MEIEKAKILTLDDVVLHKEALEQIDPLAVNCNIAVQLEHCFRFLKMVQRFARTFGDRK